MNGLRTRRFAPTKNTVTWIVDFPTTRIEVSAICPEAPEWTSDVMKYLNTNELLSDGEEARKVRNRVPHFTVIEGVLYKKDFSKPLLRCVS